MGGRKESLLADGHRERIVSLDLDVDEHFCMRSSVQARRQMTVKTTADDLYATGEYSP